jgi:drug/metabolite transporter (DMT)-like permease
MTAAFGAAILSAVCYGLATALQARSAREATGGAGSLLGVLRRWPFLLGVVLDVGGFAAQLVALRYLPLFVVQAAQAGNLAVTALACVPILGIRLGRPQWVAVVAVCAGLALLGTSGGAEGTTAAGLPMRFALLGAAVVLGAAALLAARLRPPSGPIIQGAVAGLGFGLTALAVRAVPALTPADLIRDPAAYAVAVSGLCAFLSFAAGLQRGSVTMVAALVIVGETALPAVIGIALWHDRTRPGWEVAAVAGFVLAVAGALALSRFAEPAPEPPPDRPDPNEPDPSRPDPNEPDPSPPDQNKPDPSPPDPNEPEPSRPDPNEHDVSRPDSGGPDPNQPTVHRPA